MHNGRDDKLLIALRYYVVAFLSALAISFALTHHTHGRNVAPVPTATPHVVCGPHYPLGSVPTWHCTLEKGN
jgi:hypothetical protein